MATATAAIHLAPDVQRFIDKTALLATPARLAISGATTAVEYRYVTRLVDGQPCPLYFTAFKCHHPVTMKTVQLSRVKLCKAWAIARNDTLDMARIIMILTNSKCSMDPVFQACLHKATILIGCYNELAIALVTLYRWETISHLPTDWSPMPAPLSSLAALHDWPHRLNPNSPSPETITPVFIHSACFLLATNPNELTAFRKQLLKPLEGTPLGMERYALPAWFCLFGPRRKQETHGEGTTCVRGRKRQRPRTLTQLSTRPRREVAVQTILRVQSAHPRVAIASPERHRVATQSTIQPPCVPAMHVAGEVEVQQEVEAQEEMPEYRKEPDEDGEGWADDEGRDEDELVDDDGDETVEYDEDEIFSVNGYGEEPLQIPPDLPALHSPEKPLNLQDDTTPEPAASIEDNTPEPAASIKADTARTLTAEDKCVKDIIVALIILIIFSVLVFRSA